MAVPTTATTLFCGNPSTSTNTEHPSIPMRDEEGYVGTTCSCGGPVWFARGKAGRVRGDKTGVCQSCHQWWRRVY